MKQLYRVCAALLCLLLLSGCGSQGLSAKEIAAIDAEETYSDALICLAVYSSLDELYAAADVVVEGVVRESTAGQRGYTQTTSQLEITRVLAGDCAAGDVLAVTEEGGTTTMGRFTYLGVPPMEPDGQYLLFLTKQDEQGRRFVVGAFQGKFVLREGYYFQQATQEVKLSREAYTPVPAADFPTPDL